MKTPFPILGSAASRSTPGWTWAALAWLSLCPPSVAADNWALRFNGSTQYVQVPLGETIVMDDQGPRVSLSPGGAWTAASATNAWQGSSVQTTNSGAEARWTPLLPRAGTYEVYAWWGGTSVSLCTNAQYVVKHAAGSSTNVVNQNTNAGVWTLLGSFVFQANREEYVALRPGGASGVTLADAVRFVNKQAFDLTQSLTLETWINTTNSDQPRQEILTKGEAWGLLRDSDYITFRTRDGSGATHDLTGAQPLATNRWYHLAATFDGVRKILYVDGTVTASAIWPASLATNRYPVWFGGNAATLSSNYFRGNLENVRIWSVVRSQSDLQTYTNRNLRGSEAGLLGDWRFDDNPITNFTTRDSSAADLDGLLCESNAPPTQVAGRSFEPPFDGSLALRFNGFDQYVVLSAPADGRFDCTTAGTIETWVYFDFAPAAPVSLISKGTSAWDLALNENGKIVFRTGGVTPTELLSKTRLDAGTWYHLAAVWDGAVGRKEIYLNGVLDAAATGLPGPISSSGHAVHFAARPHDAGRGGYFEGVLDEVRLWSMARQGTHIYEDFGCDLNGTEPGLVGFWKFDEGGGLVVGDKSPQAAKANGVLAVGMTSLNRVAGQVLSPALLLQYCLSLDGQEEYIRIEPTSLFNLTNLTIEAWIKPIGTNFKTILQKGDYGYGLAIDGGGYLRFASTKPLADWPRSTRPLELECDAQGNPILDAQNHPLWAWNHVAVVVNRAANTTTFYLNGQPVGTNASSFVVNNTGPIFLGRGWMADGTNYFQGLMDEVRLWNIPRSSVEIDLFAFTPLLGTVPPGLIGYWTFNEGTGTNLVDHSSAGRHGSLVNLDLANWQDGTDWGLPPLPGGIGGLNPNPDAAGLWVGQVVLNQVNEVQKATQGAAALVTPAADAATIRILLHVAADGQVRMLKDVIVMKHISAPPNVSTNNPLPPVDLSAPATNLVLVTRPELIPNFEGVMKRGGKLVGLRYGTAAYDFSGTTLPLLGGVGPSASCLGRINLSKDHPTNPYRHKYHPDHRSGFDIVRQVTLQFDGEPGDPWQQAPGYGVVRLTGTYRETVVGLHKIPLRVEGTVRLDRVNSVNVLDDGQ